jgi:hypothetical protein
MPELYFWAKSLQLISSNNTSADKAERSAQWTTEVRAGLDLSFNASTLKPQKPKQDATYKVLTPYWLFDISVGLKQAQSTMLKG